METQNTTVAPSIILGEGRLAQIDLPLDAASYINLMCENDPEAPVTIKFVGDRGFWMMLFDHRKASRAAYDKAEDYVEVWGGLGEVFQQTPCLCRLALKGKTMYIVLTDLGVDDMYDGGQDQKLVLTQGGQFDRTTHRVCAKTKNGQAALHPATKICLVEERPAKSSE